MEFQASLVSLVRRILISLFDFVGTKYQIEKARVVRKNDQSSIAISRGAPMGVAQAVHYPDYRIIVATALGEAEIKGLSPILFDYVRIGDHLFVLYRKGRFSGKLSGRVLS